ncbi:MULTISPECIES: methionine ABC transporter ATP-binding protein [Chryseobacterium]|jgi:ABC-type metal ion transport system, ATPase component|uniref:Cell division ATP-binding protein FtsE n=1 Tax=Chryseobacterium rhizosphaerae TaxID=395937 RepID=A0AAE3YED4_9FLAO|nr:MULTISPECIES: ATP-binding cassette domain-containing protein [Chryseobacterium]MBL3547204.1 ATP-binding cassette domain-containing protein [Chryseobacterium sp. KMC2]MDC8099347.1 ATP-binding cassette domain-containing protein [Chryseobacterium rhizosphaerae]MDR6528809.1 D-methionine transport system ATP-binding protein [Chryseobacterium rhizosphaerae]MDR6546208.1 D-methionine transport system ATP-binding protein [Chryseobacterium rhizosphaerae]SMC96034.1 D-methionine transport system ATP-bi
MIEIRNISKTFHQKKQSFKALDRVSLTIEKGDIVGIIGFSGAGKSTLIRTVNLLERPDEGQIIINGKDFTQLSSKQLAEERKKIGMIFQHFNLLSSRTVFDNIALPLELDHANKDQINRKVNELLKIVGLEDKAHDYPRSLSGGQKQRVAIARALANDPHLLLCDEATSALDPATTQSILQLLRDINQRLGITILLITHEMEVIKAVCNHVAVIDKGKLLAKGTLSEIISDRENPVIRQFINSDNMTLPQELNNRLQKEPQDGLFPLVEIELNENISVEELLSTLYTQYKIPYKLLKADVEYLGNSNFGKLLLQLQGKEDENQQAIYYFNQNKIQNTVKGYA